MVPVDDLDCQVVATERGRAAVRIDGGPVDWITEKAQGTRMTGCPTLSINVKAARSGGLRSVDSLNVIRGSDRAESSKGAYVRVLSPYLGRGGSLSDVGALQAYAASLDSAFALKFHLSRSKP